MFVKYCLPLLHDIQTSLVTAPIIAEKRFSEYVVGAGSQLGLKTPVHCLYDILVYYYSQYIALCYY